MNTEYYRQKIDNHILRFKVWRAGFWFVDIPRTSSSSIRIELAKKYGALHGKSNLLEKNYATPQLLSDHLTASHMRRIIGARLWKNIFTFTLVRNPWDRLVSMFNYRKLISSVPKNMEFRDYVFALSEAKSKPLDLFNEYQKQYYYSMADYILDDDGRIMVDFICRYEKRSEDLKYIGSKLGIEGLGSMHLQAAYPERKHYSYYYDNETIEIVGKIFSKDIELLGYQFENTNSDIRSI